jgi:DNA-binding CsgD family transcriptional regulator
VGRAAELAALDAAFEPVRDGRPSTVLIGGEAGIGKSRLVGEFGTRARATAAARMLYGYCLELSAEGLPFAPFTGILRDLVRDLGADGVASLLPGQDTRELARLLPELGEPGVSADPAEARARMFEQVLALFEHLAESGPLVLVIEDAHWSDRSTRDLLAFLIVNQRVLDGVLIVVTFRSDELHRGHPLRPVLAELDRLDWVERLALRGLARRQAGELMARMLGREPDPGLAQRVYARSEGNPLFLEALLRCAGSPGSDLPESLRDLVLADVRRLPAEALRVLEALSVAGQRCGHALLAAVTGLGDGRLSGALRAAVSANVLVTDVDGYVFRHSLIREAILGEVLPGEKTRWHARLAEALAADPSLVPPGRAVIEQAHHWYAAHDTARALESAWQAAATAGQALAHAEKLTMLARILELWDTLPDAAQRIGASHLSVLESAVEATLAAGEGERGIAATYESHVLEGVGEHERAAQAARQGMARAREYGLARVVGTILAANLAEPLVSLGRWDEAADVIEHALELSPPRSMRAVLLQLASEMTLARGDLAGAAESAAACRGALARLGYRDETHLPLARLEIELRLARDQAGDALTAVEDALGRFDLLGSPRYAWPLLAAGARACGTALTARDLAGRAPRPLGRLRAQAEKMDAAGPLQQAHRLTFAAEAARADGAAGGQGADALAGWDAAAEAWDHLGQPYPLVCALLRAAEAALDCGDRDGPAERLARAAALADRLGAGPLREQIGSLARRARLGLPAAEEPPGLLGLTVRETQVLRLVAAGCTNRDIAAELFISAKTASVHVSNIMAKLGVHTRVEAAAIAHRAGITTEGT